jgi:hypothetical protein
MNPATSFYKNTTQTSLALKASRVDAVATHYPGVGAAMGHHRGSTLRVPAGCSKSLAPENLPNPPFQRRGA